MMEVSTENEWTRLETLAGKLWDQVVIFGTVQEETQKEYLPQGKTHKEDAPQKETHTEQVSQGKKKAGEHNVPRMDRNDDRRKDDAELVTGQEESEIFEGITVIHAAGCRARRRMEPCNLKTMMRTPARLNGVELVVLNDSGAEVSVMSAAAAAEAHLEVTSLRKKDAQVCNADGSPFQMKGVVETTIRLGTRDWPLRAYVLKKLQTPVLLGEDFLKKAEAELSYGRRTVTY